MLPNLFSNPEQQPQPSNSPVAMFEGVDLEKKWLVQELCVATGQVRYPVPTLSLTAGSAKIEEELIGMCKAFRDVGDN